MAVMKSEPSSIMERELVQSPARTALRNFTENKLAMAGACVFVLIVLTCVVLPLFFPLDLNYVDMTQQNVVPGYYFLKIPKELQSGATAVAEGATFGAGLDGAGKAHVWGQLSGATLPEKLYRIPEGVVFQDIACGLDHIVALGRDGKLYTWGNDRLGLKDIPPEASGRTIVQIEAGENVSVALDSEGKLYVWGSQNIFKANPKLAAGKIVKFAINGVTAIALTEGGNVVLLSNGELPYSNIPAEIQGKAIDVALTKNTAAAVTEDGKVWVWGLKEYGLPNVPEAIQGRVTRLSAGRYHYAALLEDGSLDAWGMTNFGQDDAPAVTGIRQLRSGFFNSVALDANGKTVSWGLRGYPLGTDQYGRDIFRRLLMGGRVTLTVGAISVIIAGIIGIIIGGLSGYYGGRVDMLLMRATEVVHAIPFLPLAIILSAIIGNRISENMRIVMIMFILGLLSWPSLARLTRAQILAERENEFVTAAKAMGVKETGIIFRHIMPNVIAVILVDLTLELATCMLIEATLSFLGFGIQEPSATWGNMLYSCVDSVVIRKFWWRWMCPAAALSLATISVNAMGDGLRDAIDPKSNDR